MKFANAQCGKSSGVFVSRDGVTWLNVSATFDSQGLTPPHSTDEIIRQSLLPVLENAMKSGRGTYCSVDEMTFLPAVLNPEKIICVGLNYKAHVEETQEFRSAPPDEKIGTPVLFTKTNNTLAAHKQVIQVEPQFTHVDWEGELGLIIGKRAHGLARSEWLDPIFGYTIVNDLSERALQHESSQWFAGKSVDNFGPMGPWIVTADEVANPTELHLQTRVNGKVMQDASTSDLIFDLPTLLEYISSFCTLVPGDVISTGTPGGIGASRTPPQFLHNGDTVSITISGIGTLTNVIKREGEN